MSELEQSERATPLSASELGFWYADGARERTTMGILLLLDRRPAPSRLRAAVAAAVAAQPRLRQSVVDAPFDLARACWQNDPTFDLDFHVRRYALAGDDGSPAHATLDDLFRTLGPIYERPFDRTRPLWELIELDGPGDGAAVFLRLHHAIADAVGGNAILAALTHADRNTPLPPPVKSEPPGPWEEAARARVVFRVLGDAAAGRASLRRGALLASSLVSDAVYQRPSPLASHGRARQLGGLELPLRELCQVRDVLGGNLIDVLLAIVAGAVGDWHRAQGLEDVADVTALLPIDARLSEAELDPKARPSVARLTLALPVGERDPVRRLRTVHTRLEDRKRHPAVRNAAAVTELLAALPRALYRPLARAGERSVHLVVNNVPGPREPRYLAGAEVVAAYPFAPIAPHGPASVALYGYRGRLFVGLDADATSMPDLDRFRSLLCDACSDLIHAAGVGS
jgi:WS/DGAT/MGAT family acyltransferase